MIVSEGAASDGRRLHVKLIYHTLQCKCSTNPILSSVGFAIKTNAHNKKM